MSATSCSVIRYTVGDMLTETIRLFMCRRVIPLSEPAGLFVPFGTKFAHAFIHAQIPGLQGLRRTPPNTLQHGVEPGGPGWIFGATESFQPKMQPIAKKVEMEGFTAFPILVGDIMRWGNAIPGTGRWFQKLDQLRKKVSSTPHLKAAVDSLRRAVEETAAELAEAGEDEDDGDE